MNPNVLFQSKWNIWSDPLTPVSCSRFPEPSKLNLNNISSTFSTQAQSKNPIILPTVFKGCQTLHELCESS